MKKFYRAANSSKIPTRRTVVWGTRFVVALTCACVVLSFSPVARAHNGPPFPIIVDQRVGPCVVSLWTHPDIGLGTFFVMVEAPPGGAIPGDLKIDLGIQPVSGRLAEVIYPTRREDLRGQVEFKTEVNFDRQDFFRARLIWHSAQGDGESSASVGRTPRDSVDGIYCCICCLLRAWAFCGLRRWRPSGSIKNYRLKRETADCFVRGGFVCAERC